MVLRYIFLLASYQPHPWIREHKVLSKHNKDRLGADIVGHYETMTDGIIASIVFQFAYGPTTPRTTTLNVHGEDHPVHHVSFVVPLVYQICQDLRSSGENLNRFNFKTIMTKEINGFEYNMSTRKAVPWGLWSDRGIMKLRKGENIRQTDHNLCKGIHYNFARHLALIASNHFPPEKGIQEYKIRLPKDQKAAIGEPLTPSMQNIWHKYAVSGFTAQEPSVVNDIPPNVPAELPPAHFDI